MVRCVSVEISKLGEKRWGVRTSLERVGKHRVMEARKTDWLRRS